MLKRVSKSLGAKACGGLFGDLRKAAQHPLMLLGFFGHEPTLRRIATALYDTGAYGFQKGCSPERVFHELRDSSDLEVWRGCVQYGFEDGRGGGLPKDWTVRTLCVGTGRPEDGLRPITLPPELSGCALLRAAARALPPWAHEGSAKMSHLREWLPRQLAAGHRVLIFSQLMAILGILESCLTSWGVRYLRLDGSTPVADRQRMLDEFSRDKGVGVFLLSTKAGGLGLNLVAADTVVIHDADWNPHADSQAVDRAHRLGQTRTVRVFRLLAKGTLDEHMHRVAVTKLELDKALRTSSGAAADAKAPPPFAEGGKHKGPSAKTLAEILTICLS